PDPIPDIDLLLQDERTVVVAELKWLRKPFDVRERIDRDEDFAKGVRQLQRIRGYLETSPSYLLERRILTRPLTTYDVYYVLIARDHFTWIDPSERVVLGEHDACKRLLGQGRSLKEVVDELA